MSMEFDVIVFGASGYTGRLVAEHLLRTHGVGKSIRWAMFAAVTTAYFVGIFLEERDLVVLFGDDYRDYRQRVGALTPFWRQF